MLSLIYPSGWSTKSLTQCETDLGLNLINVPNSCTTLNKPLNLTNPQFKQLQNGDNNSISLGCYEVLIIAFYVINSISDEWKVIGKDRYAIQKGIHYSPNGLLIIYSLNQWIVLLPRYLPSHKSTKYSRHLSPSYLSQIFIIIRSFSLPKYLLTW